jgi:hypothetical protein
MAIRVAKPNLAPRFPLQYSRAPRALVRSLAEHRSATISTSIMTSEGKRYLSLEVPFHWDQGRRKLCVLEPIYRLLRGPPGTVDLFRHDGEVWRSTWIWSS